MGSNNRDRNDQGRYSDRIPPETVLEIFDGREDLARPLTASDIVDELDIARRTAHNKLNALVERGELETRKVGARGRVWWVPTPSETRSGTETRERRETTPPDPETSRGREQPDPDTHAESGSQTPESEDPVDRVAREEWGETDPRIEQRKAAARAVLEYITEHGGISKQEAKEEVYPEHSVNGQNPRTWYRKNIRPVLNEVAEYNQSAREYQLREDVTLPEGASEV